MNSNRFVFLDGIRGIAAIFVFLYHSSGVWGFTFSRSYLAVDLFFILSGFVISHSYEKKLINGNINIAGFIKLRLTRLYPIFFLSILLCIPVILSDGIRDVPELLKNPALPQMLMIISIEALFIPFYSYGVYALFPINPPYWSLLFEILSNLGYAVARPILTNRRLALIVLLFGGGIGLVVNHFGRLDVGSSWGMHEILGGIIRSGFGFSLGLLMYRFRDYFKFLEKRNFLPWIAFLIVPIVLAYPLVGKNDALIDFICVTIIFPAVLVIASKGVAKKSNNILCNLGAISYPIYVFHYPLKILIYKFIDPALNGHSSASVLLTLVILIFFSFFVAKYYDVPLRIWLSSKRNNSKALQMKNA